MAESCQICGEPAKRKCTRCGRVFCDVHIRYGNPHFALGSLGGGVGYYCDDCWATYQRQVRAVTIGLLILIAIALAVLVVVVYRAGGVVCPFSFL